MKIFSKLLKLASALEDDALSKQADQIDQLIVYAKDEEPNIPDKVVEIADAIRRDNPDTSDGVAYAQAWETYCSYVNPDYEGCTSKGKSKRKSPKSDYIEDD